MNDVYTEVAREDIIMQENRNGLGSNQSISCGCGSTCSNENCRTKKMKENEVSEVVDESLDEDLEWEVSEVKVEMPISLIREIISCIEVAKENAIECFNIHMESYGISTRKNELIARQYRMDVKQAETLLERLEKHE